LLTNGSWLTELGTDLSRTLKIRTFHIRDGDAARVLRELFDEVIEAIDARPDSAGSR
jgi:hypothetical protein